MRLRTDRGTARNDNLRVLPHLPMLPALLLAASMAAYAQPKTVCTITVNSDDEKRALAQRLPAGEYRFEELLDRTGGLGSACQRGVQCDVLVVSGHFNAGDDFYAERVDSTAALNMDELERASCSESCPGVFARLKEVYLFGCESFSADPTRNAAYGESSRSRMRRIFAGVPAIYGFSSSAPVGPTAAMLLNRTFDAGGQSAFATGRPNAALLRSFKANSMTWASGLPRDATERRRMCPIFDDRLGPSQKLRALHRLATDGGTESGAFAQRIDDFFETLSEDDRRSPDFQRALATVAADRATAARLLSVARSAPPATRAHVVAVSGKLGWLDAEQQRAEYVRMIMELLARDALGFAEVRLVCGLGADGALEEAIPTVMNAPSRASNVSRAATLACMGSAEAHAQVIRAIASPDIRDVRIAEAYLRSRPVTDPRGAAHHRHGRDPHARFGSAGPRPRYARPVAGFRLDPGATHGNFCRGPFGQRAAGHRGSVPARGVSPPGAGRSAPGPSHRRRRAGPGGRADREAAGFLVTSALGKIAPCREPPSRTTKSWA